MFETHSQCSKFAEAYSRFVVISTLGVPSPDGDGNIMGLGLLKEETRTQNNLIYIMIFKPYCAVAPRRLTLFH